MFKIADLNKFVLFEDKYHQSMEPFLKNRSFALLPVGGKPLIQLWLEHLSTTNINEVYLFLINEVEQVKKFVESGSRWGLKVNIISMREDLSTQEKYKFCSLHIKDIFAISKLSKVPVEGVNESLISISQQITRQMSISIVEDKENDIIVLDTNRDKESDHYGTNECLALSRMNMRTIDSPEELWSINMALINKEIIDPLPKGYEQESGSMIDVGVRIKKNVSISSKSYIGKETFIDSNVEIGTNVLMGENCYVGSNSNIKDSLIFDNTYIGTQTNLNRVILDGSLVYNLDIKQPTWISDANIVGKIRQRNIKRIITHKVLALFLSLIFLPFVLGYVLYSLLKGKKPFIKKQVFIPSETILDKHHDNELKSLFTLDINHLFWRKIPLLYYVLRGDIDLIGKSIIVDPESELPGWCEDNNRVGMMTLFDVENNHDDVIDSHYISDSYYVAINSFSMDLKIFYKWILGLFKYTQITNIRRVL